ncbi:ribonuclease P protein component [Candidatus Karelsulcia muelleri]|uniref:ribonuclease P protein component n=1 Tax=Candidatus Karelsulcia muelleri TaxID=336810 RepID=UPI0019521A4F|nr:ribonuclease P protein component [Candidatus Karelsulcia muelleri]
MLHLASDIINIIALLKTLFLYLRLEINLRIRIIIIRLILRIIIIIRIRLRIRIIIIIIKEIENMPFVPNNKLKKKDIIKKKKIVKKIFRTGKKIENNLLKVAYLETSTSYFKVKIAFFVSKKTIIKSYQRNRIKRLMRMSYQLNKKIIPFKRKKIYYIIFMYFKKTLQNFSEIKKCFENIIQKMFFK